LCAQFFVRKLDRIKTVKDSILLVPPRWSRGVELACSYRGTAASVQCKQKKKQDDLKKAGQILMARQYFELLITKKQLEKK